jgi:hypothetical protein
LVWLVEIRDLLKSGIDVMVGVVAVGVDVVGDA